MKFSPGTSVRLILTPDTCVGDSTSACNVPCWDVCLFTFLLQTSINFEGFLSEVILENRQEKVCLDLSCFEWTVLAYRQRYFLSFSSFASLWVSSLVFLWFWGMSSLAGSYSGPPPPPSSFFIIIIIVRLITRARISIPFSPQFHYRKQIAFTTCCAKHEGRLNTSSYLCANVIRNGCTPLAEKEPTLWLTNSSNRLWVFMH